MHGQHELVIITGISGAGKLSALKTFEDLGYYAVDNLPVGPISNFADLVRDSTEIERAAPGTDVTDCPGLDAAVRAGFRWARPDGVVLLSPAAPSFGHYSDYRDRSEAFARAVRAICVS